MVLTIKTGGGEAAFEEWKTHFARYAPKLVVRHWDDPDLDPLDVRYALVWEPEPGRLSRFSRLQLILSAAAGVDHILIDRGRPAVPITRMIPPETKRAMAQFTGMAALMLLRDMPQAFTQQRDRSWRELPASKCADQVRVGVMGLGALGSATARYLRRLGFKVSGWSKSSHEIGGVHCYAGAAGFGPFLRQSDILVSLLPATPETHGILNADTLRQLPAGAAVINVGRGGHVVLDDLIDLLNAGHLRSAFLDVFPQEPLPADSPLWPHPKVIITPHSAAIPSRKVRARRAAQIIKCFEAGLPLPDLYSDRI